MNRDELLGLSASSMYYHWVAVDTEDLMIMGLIDRQYLETPFYGVLARPRKCTHNSARRMRFPASPWRVTVMRLVFTEPPVLACIFRRNMHEGIRNQIAENY
jgi:hypothetical protein